MFEVVAGILAGLMVTHWTSILVFPCFIGLIQAVSLALRPRRKGLTSRQVKRMRAHGMSDEQIKEAEAGLSLLAGMAPRGWVIYPWQFVWSAVTAFLFCLAVGGIKLLFF